MISNDLNQWARTELEKLVRIPSISFPNFDPKEVERSGEATANLLSSVGFDRVDLLRVDNCFPYVVGEKLVDPELPTALLYAHHDVQPPGRAELWRTPPFEPTEVNGRLYGRGTADDKAGILVHAAALNSLGGSLPPMNLKVIIEGEEEVGSSHLFEFLKREKERLAADVIICTDAANIQCGVPSMTVSLRGLVVFEIEVRSLKAPLHSGMWGGAVVDPTQVLVKMLAALTDEKGRLKLKSIKTSRVRRRPQKLPVTRKEFAQQAGVLKLESVPKDFLERLFYEPSYSINALQASSEKLANNIICDRAYARIGIRLTAAQNARKVQADLMSFLKRMSPKTVEVNIKAGEPCDAWETDPMAEKNRWAFSAAEEALTEAYEEDALYAGCGASIPFIAPFEKALNAPVLSLGVEDPYTLAHSENESLYLADFYKTIDAEIRMFSKLRESFLQKLKRGAHSRSAAAARGNLKTRGSSRRAAASR